jgi:hypothetical protein
MHVPYQGDAGRRFMAKDHMGKRDYVKIASYLFFDRYRKERGEDVPGVMYN